jgi:hypothetical protein
MVAVGILHLDAGDGVRRQRTGHDDAGLADQAAGLDHVGLIARHHLRDQQADPPGDRNGDDKGRDRGHEGRQPADEGVGNALDHVAERAEAPQHDHDEDEQRHAPGIEPVPGRAEHARLVRHVEAGVAAVGVWPVDIGAVHIRCMKVRPMEIRPVQVEVQDGVDLGGERNAGHQRDDFDDQQAAQDPKRNGEGRVDRREQETEQTETFHVFSLSRWTSRS